MSKSNIKEKIEYEKNKAVKLEEEIINIGGKFNADLARIDTNLQVIKEVLFKEGKISEEEFEIEYLKKIQIILGRILNQVKEIKRKHSGLVIPGVTLPKDLKRVDA